MCKLESEKEKGRIIMTEEGQKRAKIMEMIKEKKITQREAATRLDLSLRQIKRLYKKYKEIGDEGMNHGLIGKKAIIVMMKMRKKR